MLQSPRGTSRAQTLAYVMFFIAGCTSVAIPSPSVQHTAGSYTLLWLWSVFLVVGGLCAAAGRGLNQWVGEYIGLPLLGAACMVYALSLIVSTIASGRLTGITAGVVLTAIFLLTIGRWLEVNEIRKDAVTEAQIRHGCRPADTTNDDRHRRQDGG